MNDDSIKQCPGCGREFTLTQIINDPAVIPCGMQFEEDDFEWNMFYFNHTSEQCGSTFAIPAIAFRTLISEPIPDENLAGSEFCEHHCLSMDDLRVCEQKCRYAPFRRFLVSVLEKRGAPAQL